MTEKLKACLLYKTINNKNQEYYYNRREESVQHPVLHVEYVCGKLCAWNANNSMTISNCAIVYNVTEQIYGNY